MKTALLIIDMQKEFLHEDMPFYPSITHVCDHINHVAKCFRDKSLPVFLVFDEESCKPGDKGHGFIDQIDQAPSDIHIHKIHGNAFRDTDLEARLKELEVDFVLVTGFMAEGCVLATIHGAKDRDIDFAVLRDGILSVSKGGANFVEKTFPVMSYSVAEKFLEK